ncbi:glycosyltransferase family 4 protein [Planomonospora parontospora]|uniref:glycosyltransferase family 4 protein n=1 Tax=Planomonospora parontospora TaxID=58119 RepID=UPI001670B7C9|nr:glycosyltransferase family 4 protein [Planomonospora parontospora]GGL35110.1 glycosyl transferase [Planomonospora parontospora subsp. antibiotica]GII17255.1 glycosyl transferase [Planomonospora parontospora subsp. antibiotica]
MVSATGLSGRRGALRIVMVAPPWYEVPPRGYGGIESVLAELIAGLSRRGHEVTLVAAGRPGTSARFLRTYADPPSGRIGQALPEVLHAARAHDLLAGIDADVVHDHSLAGPLTAAARTAPTVVTCHHEVDGEFGEYYRALGREVSMVGISAAQQRLAPDLNWTGVVHNAVETGSFPFREHKEDWVLWLGRFNEDKGAHLAVDAARAAGRRILLAGRITEPGEREYFDREVAPRLGSDAVYVGEADAVRKRELLAGARCLLFPILWEEPFGMVMIEAMACGTPVVALRRGAVPEVVADGLTGFVRSRPEELAEAVEAAGGLDPRACRSRVRRRFDVAVMAEGYERVYRAAAAGPEGPAGVTGGTGEAVLPLR